MRLPPIFLHTNRYSEVMRRLLTHYTAGTSAVVDGRAYRAEEFPRLIAEWCTNARIKATRDFMLRSCTGNLGGFHDHPSELWLCGNERAFAEQLAAEGLVRLRFLRPAPSWLRVVLSFLSSFSRPRPDT